MPSKLSITVLTEGFLLKADLLWEAVNADVYKSANCKSDQEYATI
jgi:hypothetical protein